MITFTMSDLNSAKSHLWDLAQKTNRYKVGDCGRGVFEVLDGRRLLDSLLQWQDLLPSNEARGLSDFEALRDQQSEGPALNDADRHILVWLVESACAHEEEAIERYYDRLCQAATVFEGNEAEVRRFLLAKLWWWRDHEHRPARAVD